MTTRGLEEDGSLAAWSETCIVSRSECSEVTRCNAIAGTVVGLQRTWRICDLRAFHVSLCAGRRIDQWPRGFCSASVTEPLCSSGDCLLLWTFFPGVSDTLTVMGSGQRQGAWSMVMVESCAEGFEKVMGATGSTKQ